MPNSWVPGSAGLETRKQAGETRYPMHRAADRAKNMRWLLVALVVGVWLACSGSMLARAQGGPPFITDDPGTPGAGNWEINFGWMGQHTVDGGDYELPDADINYGWGDRIQLKLELPLAASTDTNHTTVAGLGNSLLGVKWRPFEHHTAGEAKSDENMDFSWGFYPQAVVDNPTNSVRRGVVPRGPQYYLPTELTWKWGPLAFNGEVGRWIGNRDMPDQWGRGLIVGHTFSPKFEAYGEVYDLEGIDHPPGEARQRSVTLDGGLRRDLNRSGKMRLLLMGGRSVHRALAGSGEPNWIAYVGVQFLVGHDPDEAGAAAEK